MTGQPDCCPIRADPRSRTPGTGPLATPPNPIASAGASCADTDFTTPGPGAHQRGRDQGIRPTPNPAAKSRSELNATAITESSWASRAISWPEDTSHSRAVLSRLAVASRAEEGMNALP